MLDEYNRMYDTEEEVQTSESWMRESSFFVSTASNVLVFQSNASFLPPYALHASATTDKGVL